MDGQSIYGYDFRFNEKILKGPEVLGKYSADLFVNRAKAVFEEHRALEEAGKGRPWFTYLSFQSVHTNNEEYYTVGAIIYENRF